MRKQKLLTRLTALALCALLVGCAGGPESPPSSPAPAQLESSRQSEDPIHAEEPTQAGEPAQAEGPAQAEEPAPDDALTPFLGVWQDPDAPQCRIDVRRGEDGGCLIDITWTSGADTSLWHLTGAYDEIWEGVSYLGTRQDEHPGENGGVESTLVHEEATGLLYFEDSGALIWLDDFDHMGENLSFVREA